MNIIFFGTSEFAVSSLESLYLEENINILAVITQPDKPAGRNNLLQKSPVKLAAEKLNLSLFQPENKQKLKKILKNYAADFFVVIAYGMIFDREILDLPKYYAVNIHGSLLPQYRGASPIQESLLHGDHETGISIIKMDEKMDHGKILLIRRINILENDNFETLSTKLSKISAEILPHLLQDLEEGKLTPISQEENKASYCKKIQKSDGKISWNASAKEIKNMIRAYTPWPGTYTEVKNKKLKILETEISEEKLPPGKFIVDKKILKIGTKQGALLPTKVQLEGKNPVDIVSFINGNRGLCKSARYKATEKF